MKKIFLGVFVVTVASMTLSVGFAGLAGEEGFIRVLNAAQAQQQSSSPSPSSKAQQHVVETTFLAEGLQQITIQGISSDIRLLPSSDNHVHLRYTYKTVDPNLTPQTIKSKIWSQEGDTASLHLDISKDKDKKWPESFSDLTKMIAAIKDKKGIPDGRAEIRIPTALLKSVQIRGVSGDFKAEDLSLDALAVVLVSGDVELKRLTLKELDIKTVSGDIEVHGHVERVNAKSVSGEFEFESLLAAPVVEFSTSSGDAEIKFQPGTADIQVDFETVSGTVKVLNQKLSEKTKSHKLGMGTGTLKLKSVSGDIEIK